MSKELSEGAAWKQINDLFGDDSVMHPEQAMKVDIIKTRSPELDRAITIGGWPRGRFIQLAGKESSGKTFMGLMAMAEWQSLDPENCCLFIDAEYTYDPIWAESLGIDNDRVLLVKTNSAQVIFSGLCGSHKKNKLTGKVTKNPGLLDMITSGDIISHMVNGRKITLHLGKMGVVVLDSIAAMEVPAEAESEVGKQNMALMARFLSVELKKLTPAIAKANVAFIAINQVRVDLGKMFGNPEGTSGGKALKHACSLMVEVAPISSAENTLMDEFDDKIGHKVRAKISKNKLAPPNKKAEFFIDFRTGVVKTEEELLNLGCLYGLIERPNNRTYVFDDEKLSSREAALEFITMNLEQIENRIRDIYLSGQKPISKVENEIENNGEDDTVDSVFVSEEVE